MKQFVVKTREGDKAVMALHACSAVNKALGCNQGYHLEEVAADATDQYGDPPIEASCVETGVTHYVIYVEHG